MINQRNGFTGGNQYGVPLHADTIILDTTTNTWTNEQDFPVSSGVSKLGCMSTNIDGEDGLLATGGCTDNCEVQLCLVKSSLNFNASNRISSRALTSSLTQARAGDSWTTWWAKCLVHNDFNANLLLPLLYSPGRWRPRRAQDDPHRRDAGCHRRLRSLRRSARVHGGV